MKKTRFSLKRISFRKRWRRRDVMMFLERLGLYLSAGLTVNEALRISEKGLSISQAEDIKRIRTRVEHGESLSSALTHSMRISRTTTGLIAHGEAGGKLAGSIVSAHALLEREDELLKKCLSALTYPIAIGLFACALTLGLVEGVMPQIIPMLQSMNVELPFLTRVVIALSKGLISYGLYGGVILCFIVAILILGYRKIPRIRSVFHQILGNVPLVGSIIRSYTLSVFLRSCGALVESGVPLSRAYPDTVATISFTPLRSRLASAAAGISGGTSLSEILSDGHMPLHVAPLVAAGEATGSLGDSLIRAASIIDRDIEHSLKRLTSLIEPVMMAGMGCAVGAIALSIIMPIYGMSKALQHF